MPSKAKGERTAVVNQQQMMGLSTLNLGRLQWPLVVLLALIVALLSISLAGIRPFYYDNFVYAVKGLEISRGDWDPVPYSVVGWPMVLGAVYWLFQISSFRPPAATLLGGLLLGATVPFAYILLRPYLTGLRLLAAGFLWALFCLAYFLAGGYTEPLYTVLLLLGSYLLLRRPWSGWLSLALAGLIFGFDFVVRHQAAVLGAAGVAYLLLPWGGAWRRQVSEAALFAVAFVIAAAPAWLHRLLLYGNPADYGYNTVRFTEDWRDLSFVIPGTWGQLRDLVAFGPDLFNYYPTLAGVIGCLAVPLGLWLWSRGEFGRNDLLRLACITVILNFLFLVLIWPTLPNFRFWAPYLLFLAVPALTAWERIAHSAHLNPRALLRMEAAIVVVIIVASAFLLRVDAIRTWRAISNIGDNLSAIAAVGNGADPTYVAAGDWEIAQHLAQCCQDSRILNVGAGQGSFAFSIARHFPDVTIDKRSGHVLSPQQGIEIAPPDVAIQDMETFLATYQSRFEYLMVAPGSYSDQVEFPYLQPIRQPESRLPFRKVYTAPNGTELYRFYEHPAENPGLNDLP
jgi:hypothetical protein